MKIIHPTAIGSGTNCILFDLGSLDVISVA